jgi:serine protease AprX
LNNVRRAICTIVAVALAVSSLLADSGPDRPAPRSKLSGGLHDVAGLVRVIVRTRPGRSLGGRLRDRGSLKLHAFINATTLSIQADDLAELESDDDVESVSLDVPVTSDATPASPAAAQSSQDVLLATLGLPMRGSPGRGWRRGDRPGNCAERRLSNSAFFDFTAPRSWSPYDDYGHGTHVSGLIAGNGARWAPAARPLYRGIAPQARIISLKVLDAHGVALTSTVLDAIEFAIANRRALGIDVINLSLGHPILEPAATDPLVQAVEAAVRAGIVVVVSAGNVGRNVVTGAGYAGILSAAPSAITVGAFDARTCLRGRRCGSGYSSRGPAWQTRSRSPIWSRRVRILCRTPHRAARSIWSCRIIASTPADLRIASSG